LLGIEERTVQTRAISMILAVCLATSGLATQAVGQVESPSELYGELFEDVQMERVFPDSKTFVDAIAKDAPGIIVQRYHEEKQEPGFDLAAFVARNFTVQRLKDSGYHSIPGQDVCSHIDSLWSVLARKPDRADPRSSLLPLPYPYVVPGGRFNEIYYWDSYFTMLGLEESGRHDMALNMVRNFVSLIKRYGHIPNGNRSYYLSRSQPPFFAAMVELVAAEANDRGAIYAEFLGPLSEEYAFWMEGANTLAPGSAHRRVVRLNDGPLLNRYWDDRDIPREESFREDVETAKASGRPHVEVYRNLRAAAESGWDFSSRWLMDGKTLSTIRTTELVPVDLNSLMVHLETTLARAYAAARNPEKAAEFNARAELRAGAVRRYLWNPDKGVFTDYLWREEKPNGMVTAATLAPLFFGLATKAQAERVADMVRARLLQRGGLATSTVLTGQQWDAPNAWAPLQWIAIEGLKDYGEIALAETIAQRWMLKVITAYRATGKLMEKYNAEDSSLVTGGGEYPTQDGFGWTNGVLRKLLILYPSAVASRPGASWCVSSPANDNLPAARPRAGGERAGAR
jgi:alpha,alpha-trehalase